MAAKLGLIEFAGLPGSGKTTLARILTGKAAFVGREQAVRQSLRARDDGLLPRLIKRLPQVLWHRFLGPEAALEDFILRSGRHLDLVAFCTGLLANCAMEPELKTSIWRTLARSLVERELLLSHPPASAAVVLDEAFFQRSFTLFAYMAGPPVPELVDTYAALAPISDTVFWINTPPDVCIRRLAKRFENRPCPYDLSSSQLIEDFERGKNVLGHVADILNMQGKTLFVIDGGADLATTTRQIQDAAGSIGEIVHGKTR